MTKRLLLPWIFAAVYSAAATSSEAPIHFLEQMLVNQSGIGARLSGSPNEVLTSEWIAQQWRSQGYQVRFQHFTYQHKGNNFQSQNVSVELHQGAPSTLVIGAHYDATGAGSLGTIDNGTGVALMLALSAKLKTQSLRYNLIFVAFGAEEVGLHGSRVFAPTLNKRLSDIAGMINLDTIAGGDHLYIHSAHSTPYFCDRGKYSSSSWLRDKLHAISIKHYPSSAHQLHKPYDDYPQGETGEWSDHVPFSCLGIPIAYIESTNFDILGEDGFDGYSQTRHPALWDCFDTKTNGACHPATETQWGKIWHTEFDSLALLNRLFPDRIEQQMAQSQLIISEFLLSSNE